MNTVEVPLILTITGPSTSGKSELSKDLEQAGFVPLVSTTTRAPRVGEEDGVSYHFISREEFKKRLEDGLFIEDVSYDGNSYGVSVEEAQRAFSQGKPAVLVAEPHGVHQITEYAEKRGWNMIRVFLNNPVPVLTKRLLERFAIDIQGINVNEPSENDAFQAKLDAHSGRMAKILTQEQDEWVRPAQNGDAHYHLFIPRFESDNRKSVFGLVMKMATDHAENISSKQRPRP
jgi:guanylate kinase